MLGYDYEIIYKKGKENIVVDAFSQQHEEEDSLFALSLPIMDWIEEVCQEWLTHPTMSMIIHRLQEDPNPPLRYTWKDNILRHKDHLVLSPSSSLKLRILMSFTHMPLQATLDSKILMLVPVVLFSGKV